MARGGGGTVVKGRQRRRHIGKTCLCVDCVFCMFTQLIQHPRNSDRGAQINKYIYQQENELPHFCTTAVPLRLFVVQNC